MIIGEIQLQIPRTTVYPRWSAAPDFLLVPDVAVALERHPQVAVGDRVRHLDCVQATPNAIIMISNEPSVGIMAINEAQINLRLSSDLDSWVEARAGGKREKPAFVREILERERAREEEGKMLEIFNRAWDSLSPEEQEQVREEREDWTDAYAGVSRP